MRKTTITVVSGIAALGIAAVPALAKTHHHQSKRQAQPATASRLDDGKDLLPKANITEQEAIRAAQTAASGDLNEVDLEYVGGKLVFNVDVGNKDVKVDADSGKVVRVDQDD